MTTINRSLHWTQRIALIRHNLHAACRSGDFAFFKHLQAQGFIDGTNHVAILSATLGDEADILLAALDDLNAAIAQIHEDAFKNVYESLKSCLSDDKARDESECRSKIFVDTTMQKQMADLAIDKMTNSAIALIQQQPSHVQDVIASVWIEGTAIVADAIEITLKQMDSLENNLTDFIRLENSWAAVRNTTMCTITALRGIYNLMDVCESHSESSGSRRGSFVRATGMAFRRLSSAFTQPSPTQSRPASFVSARDTRSSISSVMSSFSGFEFKPSATLRHSMSGAVPDRLPDHSPYKHTDLSPIPPTPAQLGEDNVNPFDTSLAPPVPEVPAHVSEAIPA